ncbi:MAG: hydroxymethylbilane synthase [Acidimicrobiia bacterium]|jgi:hydroxymethylbilane synthase
MPARLRVATRGSELARAQTAAVIARLGVDADVVVVSTTGDQRTDAPIHALGGTGVFVKEVQEAVLAGDADIAVHSAKDLPSLSAPGLVLAAVPERGDARDALVGSTLADLPTGARVGTGAVRRRAQLAAARPDLEFGELRGNIGTRLEKAAGFDAVVVAAVALERLGLAGRIAERLDPAVMLPQVGQGAIAVECRADDDRVRALLAAVDDTHAHAAVAAERAFLAQLGGGCNLPCGALAGEVAGGVEIEVLLASLDGRTVLRARASGADPEVVGVEAARRLLDEHGGRSLLEEVA